jgi:hypothetical protein
MQVFATVKQLLALDFPGRTLPSPRQWASPALGGGGEGGSGLTPRALARMFGVCAAHLMRTKKLKWEQVTTV